MAKDAKDEAINEMKNAISNRYIKGEEKEFSIWHKDTCSNIKNCFSNRNIGEDLFSDGNGQKIVNMSLKYLDMMARIPRYRDGKGDVSNLLRAINKDESVLHIPIDSYIIDIRIIYWQWGRNNRSCSFRE